MRILIISMAFPYPLIAGGRIRVFNLIKRLSRNHSIFLLSLVDSKGDIRYAEMLKPYCEKVETVVLHPGRFHFFLRLMRYLPSLLKGIPTVVINKRSHKMLKKVREVLEREAFDCVQFEWLQMAQYLPADLEGMIKGKDILIEHDVAYLPLERRANTYKGLKGWFWNLEYRRMLKYEREMMGKFRKVVVMSEDDKKRLISLNGNLDIEMIPNGVDCAHYSEKKAEKEPYTLLFTGWMRHDPNVDGIIFFLRDIFPLILAQMPQVRLYIVGPNPPGIIKKAIRRFGDRIILTDLVDDIRDYIHRAYISIAPLRVGGGTRLKILESMAAGTSVVSTSIGCEGLEVIPGEHLLVADEPEDFAIKVVSLLNNEKERRRIEENALRLAREKYDWEIIASKMERVYEGVKK